jgi:flavin reductase (DIM6/NTAB) family NADH-FMN oxidoreductase RutF
MTGTEQRTGPETPIRGLEQGAYWLPYPLTLITAAAGERRNVMMAVRAMHFEYDPNPSVVVGIARESVTGDLIGESCEFGLNILATTQAELLQKGKQLARVPSDQVDKFALYGVETFQGDVIAAPLIKGCACNMECRVRTKLDGGGEYYLLIADVLALHGFEERLPMVMFRARSITGGSR